MKNINSFSAFLFASFLLLAVAAGAQTKDGQPQYDTYCMHMNGGKLVVMYQGKILNHEVDLDNGGRLKPNGTIVKRKGETIVLKEGECVDPRGKIISAGQEPK